MPWRPNTVCVGTMHFQHLFFLMASLGGHSWQLRIMLDGCRRRMHRRCAEGMSGRKSEGLGTTQGIILACTPSNA